MSNNEETSNSNIYYVVLTIVVCLVFGAILVFTIGVKNVPDYSKQLESSYELELNLRKQVMSHDSLREYTQLDSLLAQWQSIMKQEQVVQKAEPAAAEQNVAIWLAVIAAICTMLPIVIGINQNLNFNRELDFIKKDFDDKSEYMEEKIGEMKDNVSNDIDKKNKATDIKLKELDRTSGVVSLLSIINSLAITVRILSELEDLEIRQSVSLTCPNLLKVQLDKMVMYCDKCAKEYRELKQLSLEDEKLDMISDGGFGVLVMMHNLLKKYEMKFDGVALFELHDLLGNIWKRIHMQVSSQTSDRNRKVDEILSEISYYAPQIKKLFEGQFIVSLRLTPYCET